MIWGDIEIFYISSQAKAHTKEPAMRFIAQAQ
jgi:hypothetical protein